MTIDLDALEADLQTLHVPVAWGQIVTDPGALIRVTNAAPDLIRAVRAALTHAGAFHCVPLSPGHFYNSSDGDLTDALAPFREIV